MLKTIKEAVTELQLFNVEKEMRSFEDWDDLVQVAETKDPLIEILRQKNNYEHSSISVILDGTTVIKLTVKTPDYITISLRLASVYNLEEAGVSGELCLASLLTALDAEIDLGYVSVFAEDAPLSKENLFIGLYYTQEVRKLNWKNVLKQLSSMRNELDKHILEVVLDFDRFVKDWKSREEEFNVEEPAQ